MTKDQPAQGDLFPEISPPPEGQYRSLHDPLTHHGEARICTCGHARLVHLISCHVRRCPCKSYQEREIENEPK